MANIDLQFIKAVIEEEEPENLFDIDPDFLSEEGRHVYDFVFDYVVCVFRII